MIKAVVFDLDDTLAPEMGFVRSGYEAVAKWLSAAEPGPVYEMLLEEFAKDTRNVFNRVLDRLGKEYDTAFIKELVKLYREHRINTGVYSYYDDVPEALDSLKKMGVKLGILTDGFVVSQKNKLAALGVLEEGSFDSVLVTGELGEEYMKPSAKGFLYIADKLGVQPSELMYVGDNPKKDFYVKTKLPMTTVRIIRPESVYRDAEYLEDVKEDIRITTLKELIGYVKQ